VALRGQFVDLVGRDLPEKVDQRHRVGEVDGVEDEALPRLVRVLVDAIKAPGGDGGRPAHDAVDLVALGQEQFGQVRTVLAGNAGDRRRSLPTLLT
jgi:hypothetical protein